MLPYPVKMSSLHLFFINVMLYHVTIIFKLFLSSYALHTILSYCELITLGSFYNSFKMSHITIVLFCLYQSHYLTVQYILLPCHQCKLVHDFIISATVV